MTSEVNLPLCVGQPLGTQAVSWNRRDSLLYNTSLYPLGSDHATGSEAKELEYLYERAERFRVIPSYALVLPLKGAGTDVNDFAEMVGGRGEIPGFPKLDPNTLVHAEQSLVLHRAMPVISGDGWKLHKRVTGVHDKKSGLILESESVLVDSLGRKVATMVGSSFYRGGGQGTGFSRSIAEAPPAAAAVPSGRAPDFSSTYQTSPLQAVLYRLSGDYNPLHIDPSIGASGGLGGVILHGLCSYGVATRAVLKALNPSDGAGEDQPVSVLKSISARFTSPVKPGDALRTDIWIVGDEPADGKSSGIRGKVLAFEQTIVGSGRKSLGNGTAVVRVEQVGAGARL